MFIKYKYKQKILIKGLTGRNIGSPVEYLFKWHSYLTVSKNLNIYFLLKNVIIKLFL